MLGLFEAVCAPWKVGGVPGRLLLRRAAAGLGPDGPVPREGDGAGSRCRPRSGIRKFFCGPESFTPDLQPVVGEAPEVRNYFVAAGLNSIGILTGGGLGRALAHWIVDGRPDIDVTGMNIDRLHSYQANPEYRATRTVESLGMVYQCHYPTPLDADGARRQAVRAARPAGRARRVLPRRQRLGGRRLVRPGGRRRRPSDRCPGAGRTGSTWWAAEHRAAREDVIAMDMSFMSKFLVQGRDAGAAARAPVGQPRRRRAGRHHLHPVAQRGRHARGRPHRHQARRRAVLGRRLRHRAPARRDLDAPAHRRRPARVRHRRDARASPSSTCRGRGRASCCSR